MELAWFAAAGTAVLFGLSALLEDDAAKSVPADGVPAGRSVLRATTRPAYVAGMLLSIIGWALSLLALQRLPLFAVQAVGASSIGIVVVAHRIRSHVVAPRRETLLLVGLGLGLTALAVSAEPGGPAAVSDTFATGMWIGVVVLGAVTVTLLRGRGRRTSALLGTISGLSYGATALCARALEADGTLRGMLLDPLTVALAPFAAIGIVCFAASLQRGSVSVATATQHAAMTVVPSAIGLALLGDHARPGFELVALTGFALTVGAVVALTMTATGEPRDASRSLDDDRAVPIIDPRDGATTTTQQLAPD